MILIYCFKHTICFNWSVLRCVSAVISHGKLNFAFVWNRSFDICTCRVCAVSCNCFAIMNLILTVFIYWTFRFLLLVDHLVFQSRLPFKKRWIDTSIAFCLLNSSFLNLGIWVLLSLLKLICKCLNLRVTRRLKREFWGNIHWISACNLIFL